MMKILIHKDGSTLERRIQDLRVNTLGSSIAPEPHRIKLRKTTVLGIILDQGSKALPKAGASTHLDSAEKIEVLQSVTQYQSLTINDQSRRRAQARAHIVRFGSLERENKRLKATIEKRDGQIKGLVDADKENRHSRHFGNEVCVRSFSLFVFTGTDCYCC